ncbi:amino acid ABC transporter permease [Microvirga aerophila]|uniref:Transport system permease n=1 Tax=Microvirga aerophila TaxID=670291 RepID=A0A512BXP0_9HYPH|nr:ABC transporter permease subunit [Microvirga aerophila]GEO16720.1 transport system permease [Microvirga aerophila]
MIKAQAKNVLFVSTAMALVAWLLYNLGQNLESRGLGISYAFLLEATSFPIGESMISYRSGDTYLRALTVGFLNTVKLSIAGIVLATLFGAAIGLLARMPHPLVRAVTTSYVEFTRNVPLLLILVICASAVRNLPPGRQAWTALDTFFISSRGLYMPWPVFGDWGLHLLVGFVALALVFWLCVRAALESRERTGRFPARAILAVGTCLIACIVLITLTWSVLSVDRPVLAGFNFRGGWSITPEYLAMLFGLAFYTSGFIAEIVRGALASLPKGQREAANALGMSRSLTLWLVLVPQALRLMLPPLANQYLNLTKNSTLAVLIGYPDLVSVGNTALNQTGRAIETVSIYLFIYLALSLATSYLVKRLEQRSQLIAR